MEFGYKNICHSPNDQSASGSSELFEFTGLYKGESIHAMLALSILAERHPVSSTARLGPSTPRSGNGRRRTLRPSGSSSAARDRRRGTLKGQPASASLPVVA